MLPGTSRLTTILVIDHHKTKRSWLAKVLAEAAFEVVFAEDAESGFAAAERDRPDGVVVTLTLPRVSGSEFSQRFKDTPRGADTPVVLTSSLFRNMNLDTVAQKRWRADAFLEEPYTAEALVGTLHLKIDEFRTRRAAAPPPPPYPEPSEGSEIDPFDYVKRESVDFDPIEAALAAADVAVEVLETEVEERLGRERDEARRLRSTPETPSRLADLMIEPEGNLDDASVPEILASCFFAKITGLLVVSNRKVAKTVYLKDGCPVHVTGDIRGETLGQLLVNQGVIDEKTLYETLPALGEGKRLGDALIENGALSTTQLYQSLKMQAWEKMLSLFAWHGGAYRIVERAFDPARLTSFEMWPPLLILQGVLRHYDPTDIRLIMSELKDFVLIPRGKPPVTYDELRVPEEVRSLYELVDGRRTVAEAVAESRLGAEKTYQVFYVLLILELFDKIDPGRANPSADLPEAEISFDELVERAIAADLTPAVEGAPAVSAFDEPDLAPISDLAAELEPEFEPELESVPASPPVPEAAPEAASAKDGFDLSDEEEDEEPDEFEIAPPRPAPSPTPRDEVDEAPPAESEADAALAEALDEALDGFLVEIEEDPEGTAEHIHKPSIDEQFLLRGPDRSEEELSLRPLDGDPGDAPAPSTEENDKALLDLILKTYMRLEKASHYDILGVQQSVADHEIREAYTNAVKAFHPDKLQARFTKEIIDKADAIMKRATDAYRTLYDTKRRRLYDKQLAEGGGAAKERSVAMILAAENEFSQGLAAIKQVTWDTAKRHFQKAVDLFPEEGEYYGCLGWAIYNMAELPRADRNAQAKTLFEKAIKLNPRSDRAYYYLGMLLKDNDQFDKAAIMFAQAFRYNKGNIDAKAQLKAIQSLRGRKPSAPAKKSLTAKDVLGKDVKLDTIKKTILKIFW